jgi:hypothetical protein
MEKEMTDTTETEINPFDDIDLETEIPDISPNPFDDIDHPYQKRSTLKNSNMAKPQSTAQ